MAEPKTCNKYKHPFDYLLEILKDDESEEEESGE